MHSDYVSCNEEHPSGVKKSLKGWLLYLKRSIGMGRGSLLLHNKSSLRIVIVVRLILDIGDIATHDDCVIQG
jgi:hypothetical protein